MAFAIGNNTAAYARLWHLVDARGEILGHLSRGIAATLTGELKPVYNNYQDIGDHVVVINARNIVVSGDKMSKKFYYSHSGYPGGMKKTNLATMLHNKPEEAIRQAVAGMLPKNKLRPLRLNRLHIFADDQHPYAMNLARYYEDPDLQKISSRYLYSKSAEELLQEHDQLQMKRIEQLMAEFTARNVQQ
eukprot:Partr_v1_DN27793_c1_g1_i1_m67500 putative ribosomal protein